MFFLFGDDDYLISQFISDETSKNLYSRINKHYLYTASDLEVFLDKPINIPFFFDKSIELIYLNVKSFKSLESKCDEYIDFFNTFFSSRKVMFILLNNTVDKSFLKLAEESKFFNKFNFTLKSFLKPKPWQLDLIKNRVVLCAEKYNISFNDDALNKFTDFFKDKLDYIDAEVKKLSLFSYPDVVLDSLLLEKVYSSYFDINNLYENFIKSNFNKLLLPAEFSPVYILAILQNKLRESFKIKLYLESKISVSEIASILKIHPYKLKLDIGLISSIKSTVLKEVICLVSEIEYKIKTGALSPDKALPLVCLNSMPIFSS